MKFGDWLLERPERSLGDAEQPVVKFNFYRFDVDQSGHMDMDEGGLAAVFHVPNGCALL